jgi:hypothetical protein
MINQTFHICCLSRKPPNRQTMQGLTIQRPATEPQTTQSRLDVIHARKSAIGAAADALVLRRLLTGAEVAVIMTANTPQRLTSRRRP